MMRLLTQKNQLLGRNGSSAAGLHPSLLLLGALPRTLGASAGLGPREPSGPQPSLGGSDRTRDQMVRFLCAAVLLCYADGLHLCSARGRGLRVPPRARVHARVLMEAVAGPSSEQQAEPSESPTAAVGAPRLAEAYRLAGKATVAAWSATALVGLTTHPKLTLPLWHNVLAIAQAVAMPLPLCWAVMSSLSSAATVGFRRLGSVTYRRLNLGMSFTSLWLSAAVLFAPAFATGYDLFSVPFRVAIALVHASCAAICLGAWSTTVRRGRPQMSRHYAARLVRGLVGSVFALMPKGAVDDPDASAGRDGRNEYVAAMRRRTCLA